MRTKHLFYYTFKTEIELIDFTDQYLIDKEDIVSIKFKGDNYLKPWVLFMWDDNQIKRT